MKTVFFPQFEDNDNVSSVTNKPIFIISRETGLLVGMLVHNEGKWWASCGAGGFVGKHSTKQEVMRQLGRQKYYFLVDIAMPIREQDRDIAKVAIKLSTGDIIYPGSENWNKYDKYNCIINDNYLSSERENFYILDSAIMDSREFILILKNNRTTEEVKKTGLNIENVILELYSNHMGENDSFILLQKELNINSETNFYKAFSTSNDKFHFTSLIKYNE